MLLFPLLRLFPNLTFSKKSLRNTIRESNGLDLCDCTRSLLFQELLQTFVSSADFFQN